MSEPSRRGHRSRAVDTCASHAWELAARDFYVGNLFAADGALFPTSSGFNPTMTIVALATRVAAAMVSPGSPERALG